MQDMLKAYLARDESCLLERRVDDASLNIIDNESRQHVHKCRNIMFSFKKTSILHKANLKCYA